MLLRRSSRTAGWKPAAQVACFVVLPTAHPDLITPAWNRCDCKRVRQSDRRGLGLVQPGGRSRIAQRFIAGTGPDRSQVPAGTKETGNWSSQDASAILGSFAPTRGWAGDRAYPAMNRWAIFGKSLPGLGRFQSHRRPSYQVFTGWPHPLSIIPGHWCHQPFPSSSQFPCCTFFPPIHLGDQLP